MVLCEVCPKNESKDIEISVEEILRSTKINMKKVVQQD